MKEIRRGANFTEILCVAFICLKLCNQIDWAWTWVLAPMWIPLALKILSIGIKSLGEESKRV